MDRDDTQARDAPAPLELWGGIEPTINRVRDGYLDQDTRSRHSQRLDDLDRFAALGIAAIRYPILWESTAPDGLGSADWTFADTRLPRLRTLGIRPIVGLVHHGSGPRDTSLVDPAFPEKLAAYARAVAERFPWVEMYTPVNEPLTTARFAGLNGHWYPHGDDDRTFARALVTQCRGIARAMAAIRAVNPAAQLIQTEDLGKTFGTPPLADLVRLNNERRWLSLDLLCGRVDRAHPLWEYLRESGIAEGELRELVKSPCPPDIIGFDYYARSERFLDDRTDRYADEQRIDYRGQRFADLDVVRITVEGLTPLADLLAEAWERYGRPMAITESHLGSTREEQARWIAELWRESRAARARGIEMRALTLWALLGIYNWASLLTVDDGQYEPGAFDLRAPAPRPTFLARLARDLADGDPPDHPVLDQPGWWRTWPRLKYPPYLVGMRGDYTGAPLIAEPILTGRSLLITGGNGPLAHAFIRMCMVRGLAWRALTHDELDIADPDAVASALAIFRPWAVINAAGIGTPDDAEGDPARARRVLADGPGVLATACARRGIPLVTFSSDQVFDGAKGEKYTESDPPRPLSVYGRCQAAGEQGALAAWRRTLVIRTGAHFGPYEERNPLTRGLNALAAVQQFVAADDCVVTPTYVLDLCNDALDLLIDDERGIWHHAHPQALIWFELFALAARITGVDAGRLVGRPLERLDLRAPRPRHSALGSERGVLPPPLDQALGRYCADCQVGWVTLVGEETRCREAPIPLRVG